MEYGMLASKKLIMLIYVGWKAERHGSKKSNFQLTARPLLGLQCCMLAKNSAKLKPVVNDG